MVAVVGVLAFNRLQERKAQREGQRAFGSGHADVLLDQAVSKTPLSSKPNEAAHSLPDERVDYVMLLRSPVGVPAGAVVEAWHPLESRFGRRALLAGSDGSGWRRLAHGGPGTFNALRASLQLVSRAGVVSDAELIEFRSEVENMATRMGASVSAPEMRAALDSARELDRTCADADIQVALHVVGVAGAADADFSHKPFQVAPRADGWTLTLDVARTPEPARGFEAMARAGRQLAGASGRLVDDNGNPLDERALASIGAQLEAVRATLAERGIEPGSPLALRLFS